MEINTHELRHAAEQLSAASPGWFAYTFKMGGMSFSQQIGWSYFEIFPGNGMFHSALFELVI